MASAREALDVAALDGVTPRPLVLVGSRGVGKTVMLGEIAALAGAAHGWPTVAVEAQPNRLLENRLVAELERVRILFDQAPRRRRFQVEQARLGARAPGISAEATLVRSPAGGSGDQPDLSSALTRTLDTAETRRSGVVVTVDEAQLAGRSQLGDLVAAVQEATPQARPLVLVLAGLVSLRDPRRSVSYLERAEWHELQVLDRSATLRALVEPAEMAGRPFSGPAATLLAEASGGHPFAVQVYGHHAWRASAHRPKITLAHARSAAETGEADLVQSLFAARWSDASGREREYLREVAVMAAAGNDVTGSHVAAALGAATPEVSYLRDRLLKKGTLVAEGRRLRFAVPGMAEFVLRQGQ